MGQTGLLSCEGTAARVRALGECTRGNANAEDFTSSQRNSSTKLMIGQHWAGTQGTQGTQAAQVGGVLKNGVWRFESDSFDRFSLAIIDSSKNRTCEYSQ